MAGLAANPLESPACLILRLGRACTPPTERPWQRHLVMPLLPTLRVPTRWETCILILKATPIVMTSKQVWAPTMTSGPQVPSKGRGRRCGRRGGGIGGMRELARPGKWVLGLYGNVMGDCVTAARPMAADRPTTGHADGGDALAALLT